MSLSVNHRAILPQIPATSSLIVSLDRAPGTQNMTESGPFTSESGSNSPSVAQFDWILILSEPASRLSGSQGSNPRTGGLQPEKWRAPTRELEGTNPVELERGHQPRRTGEKTNRERNIEFSGSYPI